MQEFVKDPSAVLDYQFDWSSWLADGETIVSATVTAPTGLTKPFSDVVTSTTVTGWIAGGVLDALYYVVCQVTTNQGRVDERSIILRIMDR